MPAFSQIAREQMEHPMGMLGELQDLEDMLIAPGQQVIANGVGELLDEDAEGGAAGAEDQGEDNIDDEMSEPTEQEQIDR